MQNFKRVVASVMATAMLASCAGMTTFAQSGDTTAAGDTTPEYKVTITHPDTNNYEPHTHTYVAYQIFAGTVDEEKSPGKLFDITWGENVNGLELAKELVRLGNSKEDRYENFKLFSTNTTLSVMDFDAAIALQNSVEPLSEEQRTTLNNALKDSAVAVAEVLQAENVFIDDSLEMYKFAKVVKEFIKGDVQATGDAVNDPETDTLNGAAVLTLKKPGYYMFYDKKTIDAGTGGVASSAYMLNVVNNDEAGLTIEAKVDKPTLDKYILEGTDEVKVNTASIGDTIHYRLKSKVPNMVGYNKYFFNIEDTLDETLDFQENSVSVYLIKGTDETTKVPLDSSTADDALTTKSFYVTADSYYNDGTNPSETAKNEKRAAREQNIKIVLENFIQYRGKLNDTYKWENYMEGYDIIVEYDAILMENARIGDTYTDDKNNEANVNTAKLIYSNNPNFMYEGDPDKPDEPKPGKPGEPGEPDEPGDPTGETPESLVATFTTEIDIFKVDNKGNSLAGAEFKVVGNGVNIVVAYKKEYVLATGDETPTYYKLTDGTFTDKASTDATSGKYESTDPEYVLKEVKSIEKHEGTDENKVINAAVGEDGILRLTGLGDGVYTITETVAPAGYNKLKDPIIVNIDATNNNKTNPQLYSVTWKFGTDPESSDGVEVDPNGIFSITVENTPGATLPGTGSIGTIYFYIVGSLLMAGAVVLFIIKKKSEAKEG